MYVKFYRNLSTFTVYLKILSFESYEKNYFKIGHFEYELIVQANISN